jgi:hypothetical protein
MDAIWDALIRRRAGHRCEYCHFPKRLAEVPFQSDHIVARQRGGPTEPENLALAGCYCNRYKGPNLSGVDPLSKAVTRLLDPRHDRWESHFAWDGAVLVGQTPTGRTTIQTLGINRSDAVTVRELVMAEGMYPH